MNQKSGRHLEVYAHRGASGNHFENTMRAFVGAVDEGADGIELDVQLSKDRVFFVVHDMELKRLAGVRKSIAEMDASQIQQLKIGKKYLRKLNGQSIPTLLSVISFATINSIALNIELKETVSEHPESLPFLLEQLASLDRVHISSFDYALIEKVKLLNPQMEVALLLKKSMLRERDLSDYPFADAFHFHKRMMMKAPFIKYWKQTDKKIRIYGIEGYEPFVADPPSFVDGWITNYPGRFK